MDTYFKNDEYWREHINKELEEDIWINDYQEYLNNSGLCLDLGCGIGQFTKEFQKMGYEVVSADISEIALNKVKEFNPNVKKLDMQNPLPFEDNKFDIVFANLSIHYFNNQDTIKLIEEIKRILKPTGIFMGSVNGIQGLNSIKETAEELEHHFYFNKNKYIRLFDNEDLHNFLSTFKIVKIEEKETTRFNHQKNYLVFIAKKQEKKYFYHVVTERPMSLNQEILFNEKIHNGVYDRIYKEKEFVDKVYNNQEIEINDNIKKALREFALEETRKKEYPYYPSRLSSLYVSRTLEEANFWYDLFKNQGRKTYAIVKIEVEGNSFTGDAWNVFEGTTNINKNIELSRHYWNNEKNTANKEPIIETIVDGKIKVIEIIKENSDINENN